MAMRKRLKQKWKKPQKPFANARKTDNSKFYQSTRWRKLRKMFVAENPVCVHCEAKGFTTPVAEVDHIIPLRLGGYPYDFNNLQSLCKSCHAKKSAKEGQQTKKGQTSSNGQNLSCH